jgi:hypothetical protein
LNKIRKPPKICKRGNEIVWLRSSFIRNCVSEDLMRNLGKLKLIASSRPK